MNGVPFHKSDEVRVGDEIHIEIHLGIPGSASWDRESEVIAKWMTRKGNPRAVVRIVPTQAEIGNNNAGSGDMWADCVFVAQPCTNCGDRWTVMCAASEVTRQRILAELNANYR